MPEYDNTNKFSIFRNDRKETDKHPDYTGTLNVDGREFWLSAWLREGKKGKFFSGSIKPKESPSEWTKSTTPGKQTVTSGRPSYLDEGDEIPFMCEWR